MILLRSTEVRLFIEEWFTRNRPGAVKDFYLIRLLDDFQDKLRELNESASGSSAAERAGERQQTDGR